MAKRYAAKAGIEKDVLDDRLDDEVVDRAVLLAGKLDQAFDWLLFHLLLWNIDRELVKNLFLCHVIHVPQPAYCSSYGFASQP